VTASPTTSPPTAEFEVPSDAAGLRLDQCLARCVTGLSRRTARIALDLGGIFVDNKRVKVASRKVYPGQRVRVYLGTAFANATKATGRDARARDEAKLPPPRILYEDEHVITVFKPAGLLTAPTPESDRNNLLSVLSHRTQPPERLFVVHRLDLHTSGVLIIARSELANQRLSETFRTHTLTRQYEVWVSGHVPEQEFSVTTPVGGKPAITHFRVLRRLTIPEANGSAVSPDDGSSANATQHPVTHLEATLETGRTHQIRIHASSMGHPVLADPKYGQRESWHPRRLALHAKRLALPHPATGEPLDFVAPPPEDLEAWLANVTTHA
jgi:23S rRNA pseudouridine1911/1915/1917 synthase